MLMAQIGTPEVREKEYIFITPLEHGLSCKLVNRKDSNYKYKLSKCYKYLDKAVEKGGNKDLYTSDYIVSRVLAAQNDFWISVDEDDEIVGCIIVEDKSYPLSPGVSVEALGGSFNFLIVVPMIEEYYKGLGYKFVELTGRKGWERKLQPLGYEFKSVIIRKKI